MLVLSRKQGQEIVLGDNQVVITVVDIRPGVVRIGINADKDVEVHRREIYDRIQENKKRGEE